MLNTKKILGLFTLFVGLTFALFSISTGQQLTDIKPDEEKATLSGTVVDAATQQPVSSATVKIPLANKQEQTGKEGKFNVSGLNTGTYKLKVEHSDYKSYSKSVEINNQDKTMTIELSKSNN